MEGGRPKMRLIVAPHERQKLFDESEQDGVAGDNADYFDHTIGEIVISEAAAKAAGSPLPARSTSRIPPTCLAWRIFSRAAAVPG